MHAKSKKYKEAVTYYDAALSTYPDYADAYTARGAANANLGLFQEAEQDLSTAIRLDPSHPYAATYLQAIRDKEVIESTSLQLVKSAITRSICI